MVINLFTASFPYGKAESFLEDEIGYLSKAFEKVVIVPLSGKGKPTRVVPENCEVKNPVITNRRKQYLNGLLCFRSFTPFVKDFFSGKVYKNTKRIREWFVAYVLVNNLLKSNTIKKLFAEIQPNDVCYFYWGKGANLLSCFYKGRANFVSRFHGEWDLWEESSGNYAPMRQRLADSLDAAVFISEKGKRYFEERYSGCETRFFPLGSADMGYVPHIKCEKLRVLSCSTVYPLKRVPLIFESLKRIKDVQVDWTHIGDGVDFEALKNQVANSCPPNINVDLKGRMSHDEVMNYYKEHQFDVFVNMSTNEGVPVSIMEAISFDIPVVATNVGGNSEIVTEESGILVSANPSEEEVATAIASLSNNDCHPRLFWEKHYSADVNYLSFADFLKSL